MSKERKMTAKGFLHKAGGKISAEGFLAQHRAWLETGELASLTSPILRKLDDKEILPTPALEAVKAVVLGHMIASEVRKGEEAIAKREAAGEKPKKNWVATIYNAKGEVCTRQNAKGETEDLEESFDNSSDADRWTDRRLFEGAPDWYGIVSHTSLINKEGEPLHTVVMRDDAIARILKTPKGPAVRRTGGSTSKLSFGVKATQDRAYFSRG